MLFEEQESEAEAWEQVEVLEWVLIVAEAVAEVLELAEVLI